MKIIGVNGINTHGAGNIDLMLRDLAELGYDTVDVRLPKRHFLSAYWGAAVDAQRIIDASADGDVVICHSFGGPRVVAAMRQRNYHSIFMFRPAMGRKTQFPRCSADVFCFYSPDDTVVELGAKLPFHVFGRAGAAGLKGPRAELPVVYNIESEGGHNADFEGERRRHNVELIDSRLRGDFFKDS